eukprot:Sro1119_g243160.2  (291) ;mRNA; r:9322-10281
MDRSTHTTKSFKSAQSTLDLSTTSRSVRTTETIQTAATSLSSSSRWATDETPGMPIPTTAIIQQGVDARSTPTDSEAGREQPQGAFITGVAPPLTPFELALEVNEDLTDSEYEDDDEDDDDYDSDDDETESSDEEAERDDGEDSDSDEEEEDSSDESESNSSGYDALMENDDFVAVIQRAQAMAKTQRPPCPQRCLTRNKDRHQLEQVAHHAVNKGCQKQTRKGNRAEKSEPSSNGDNNLSFKTHNVTTHEWVLPANKVLPISLQDLIREASGNPEVDIQQRIQQALMGQ